jgi:nitrite reductase/ring-hydroxylating ferredoxin subunit
VRNPLLQSPPIVGGPLAAEPSSPDGSDVRLAGPRGVDRRAVVAGAGLVCLLGALSGCGSDSSAAPSGAQPGASDDGVTSSDDPDTSESTASSASAAAAALAAVADVPVGGGVVVNSVLVVQPTAGTLKAFDAHCAHQGVVVRAPDAAGVVTCPAHGASYKAADGSLVKGPATRGLTPIAVKVVNGQVLRV